MAIERKLHIVAGVEKVDSPCCLTWNSVLSVLHKQSPRALSNREIAYEIFKEGYKDGFQSDVTNLTRIMYKAGELVRMTGNDNDGHTPGLTKAGHTYHYTVT